MIALGASLLAAFVVGLGGSAHCTLMCGGISAAIVSGAAGKRTVLHASFAQAGRIASYMAAGVIVATISSGALSLLAQGSSRSVVQILLGLAWIVMALQLFGWLPRSRWLARTGAAFWRQLQPLTRQVWPVNTPLRALLAGALWGWLPCGMSYAMLMVAAASGDPLQAGLMMFAFGIGTMPGTLLPALAAARLQRLGLSPRVRQIAAAAMLALGVFTVTSPWMPGVDHAHPVAPLSADANSGQDQPHH